MGRFVFTCGDVNGIGPEIVLKSLNLLANSKSQDQFVFICPSNVIQKLFNKIKPEFHYTLCTNFNTCDKQSKVSIIILPEFRLNAGYPTKESGKAAFSSLKISYQLLSNKICDAVVTAPVSKTALHLAGINFPGQTEMFAEWSGTKNYLMVFLSSKLNIALNSIHVPLKKVSTILNKHQLKDSLNLLLNTIRNDLGKRNPKMAVLGLNPHAGESGIIGEEEVKIILPVLKSISDRAVIDGPFSPDAFFANRLFRNYDMVFAMYHDQALIPFKYINFGKGVNYTAGLPIIRTSPDHGVAYDIAYKFKADESSMIEAFRYAKKILKNRKSEKFT